MKASPIPGDVLRAFDSAVLLINDLTAEAVRIKEKYGAESKLLKTKLAQIETIRELYNKAKAFIELALDHNKRLGVECMGLNLQLTQELYACTFSQAAKILGLNFSDDFIKAHDDIDGIIEKLRAVK